MKILVPVKRVIDYNVKARVKADGSGVDLANVKMAMNPFDEIAVEEAVRLKEKGVADRDRRRLDRPAAGAGDAAHRARHGRRPRDPGVATDDVNQDIEPLAVAKILKAVIDAESPDLVIAGKQAIDDDKNATGQMLAALLGWPQATFASAARRSTATRPTVTREVDGGLQTIERDAAGDRHRRPAPQRAALRQPAQHHEGEEEAARREDPGRLRRRHHAAPEGR